ncbi:hypothetical protein BT96DRAFT_57153 [Gymnopus androsaceus JB14]|uniref:Uncharacterized protein n=1 Tax=Gymnopus androsaceus JB14 TaxID=1447944 RepID=A0A6A4IBI0_9AGAR|nr:hypothetical protein BT96DRAFT_57153 [Gymnopus androsaceus JB14]
MIMMLLFFWCTCWFLCVFLLSISPCALLTFSCSIACIPRHIRLFLQTRLTFWSMHPCSHETYFPLHSAIASALHDDTYMIFPALSSSPLHGLFISSVFIGHNRVYKYLCSFLFIFFQFYCVYWP